MPDMAMTRGRSVSSVKTLEEAKTTKGCLYMQMPVQEVPIVRSVPVRFLTHVPCISAVWYPPVW